MKTMLKNICALTVLSLTACASVPPPLAESETALSPATTNYVGAEVVALPADDASDYMQRLQQALVSALAKTALNPQPKIQIIKDDVLLFSLPTTSSFEVNSGELRPAALATYGAIAEVLRQYQQSVVHVMAFASAPSDANLTLSVPNRQVAAIVAYWMAQGIPASRLRQTTNMVDAAPADVRSTRQVAIAIRPVVQGRENQAWVPPSLPTNN